MELLRDGLKLDFVKNPPSSYEEENNKSAREHMTDLRETVKKWQNEGAVIELENKPLFVNPLSVSVEKDDFNNIKKKRPCIDVSRHRSLKIVNIYNNNFNKELN